MCDFLKISPSLAKHAGRGPARVNISSSDERLCMGQVDGEKNRRRQIALQPAGDKNDSFDAASGGAEGKNVAVGHAISPAAPTLVPHMTTTRVSPGFRAVSLKRRLRAGTQYPSCNLRLPRYARAAAGTE